jgi:hypothetical protein
VACDPAVDSGSHQNRAVAGLARGHCLGFGLKPMRHVLALRAALAQVDEVRLPAHLISRRTDLHRGWFPARRRSRRRYADGLCGWKSVFFVHGIMMAHGDRLALWGVHPMPNSGNSGCEPPLTLVARRPGALRSGFPGSGGSLQHRSRITYRWAPRNSTQCALTASQTNPLALCLPQAS